MLPKQIQGIRPGAQAARGTEGVCFHRFPPLPRRLAISPATASSSPPSPVLPSSFQSHQVPPDKRISGSPEEQILSEPITAPFSNQSGSDLRVSSQNDSVASDDCLCEIDFYALPILLLRHPLAWAVSRFMLYGRHFRHSLPCESWPSLWDQKQ